MSIIKIFMLFSLDMCHNSAKKVSALYGLLEEYLCETKHVSYISMKFKCDYCSIALQMEHCFWK